MSKVIRFIRRIFSENIEYMPVTKVIASMSLKKRHMTSDLGGVWEVLRPLMYILMFYVALSMGFKSAANIDGMVSTYFIWLASGIVAWFYLQDFIVGGATCFMTNKALLCKSQYPVTAVPLIMVIANLKIHVIMVGILMAMAVISGTMPSIYWLQIPVYMGFMIVFAYVWSYLTGLMNTVSPDILDFIKTVKPAFFWLSGILFNTRGRDSIVFLINPICYLVEGYRNAICFNEWFWDNRKATWYFIGVMLFMIILTYLLDRKSGRKIAELI